MAFVAQEDVLSEVESVVAEIAHRFNGTEVSHPFPRLTYQEAMERYGSDKPDLRIGLELVTLTELVADSGVGFPRRDRPRRRRARTGSARSRRRPFPAGPRPAGGAGPGVGRRRAVMAGVDRWAGPRLARRWQRAREVSRLQAHVHADDGTVLLIVAGPRDRIDVARNAVRNQVGTLLQLRDSDTLLFAWVTDFPMYELDDETQQIVFSHNPFSMPQGGLEALHTMDPLEICGWQYDLVCNGVEVSSGAIRNSNAETLYRALEIAGYSRRTVDEQFGHMIAAFRHGVPPHGGIAPGFERLLMC